MALPAGPAAGVAVCRGEVRVKGNGMRALLLVIVGAVAGVMPMQGYADPVDCVVKAFDPVLCLYEDAGAALDGTGGCLTAPHLTEPDTSDLACASYDHRPGRWPRSEACVTDGAVAIVAWWYDGVGPLVCVGTDEWWTDPDFALSGFPGACVWTGAGSRDRPTVCAGKDELSDSDGDGQEDDPVHCPIWTAGSSFCFRE